MLWVLIRRVDSNEHPAEAILMSTHNVCCYGELKKIMLELSPNTLSVPQYSSIDNCIFKHEYALFFFSF